LSLSRRLGRDFVDLDVVTAGLMGTGGPGEAIEREGIRAFREVEARALLGELKGTGRVIALGGGTPTAPGCAALLRESQAKGLCRVIYLRGSVETLQQRLREAGNGDRPALVGGDAVEEVGALSAARDPVYRELAESVVVVDGVDEEHLVRALEALVRAGA